MTSNDETISALADHIEAQLPTVDTLASIQDVADMGPQVALPAVHVHLLLIHLRNLRARLQLQQLQGRVMPDDVPPLEVDAIGDLAGSMAERAIREAGDPLVALMVLSQAAGAVCLAELAPRAAALSAFDGAVALTRERLADMTGSGAVLQ